MREIGRGLEMPATAALDEVDAAAFIVGDEITERKLNRALADMLGNFVDRQRRR